MDFSTRSHLSALRQLLLYRLNDLRADLQSASIGGELLQMPLTAEVGDSKDSAMHQQFAAVRDAEERRDIDELVCVEAALHRLDHGTYGDCLQCGEPIPLPRLLVQPAALRCATCQSTVEQARAARRA